MKIKPRTDFVLIHSEWPGQRALDFIESARETELIVVRERPAGPGPTYSVFRRRRVKNALKKTPMDPVAVALASTPKDDLLQVVTGAHGLVGVIELPREVELPREERTPDSPGPVAFSDVGGGSPPPGGLESSSGSSTANGEPSARAEPVTRELVADLPPTVPLGGEASLLVSLSATLGHPRAAPVVLPVGASIDVVVRAAGAIALVGRTEEVLRVSAPQSELPKQFKLRGAQVGSGIVTIFAFHAGDCVAKLTLETNVVAQPEEAPQVRALETAALRISPATAPDLSIFVFEGQGDVTFRLQSADGTLHMKEFGPTKLHQPAEYFRTFFRDIERLRMATPEDRANAWVRLRAKGANLFDALFPEDLRVLLWSLKDRIHSMQITSDEPWIPWELCRLKGRADGKIVEGGFFSEAFAVSRWLYGVPATRRISLRNMAVVVPRDSALPSASEERAYLLSLDKRPARSVTEIPATFVQVHNEMAKGLYDAWHFTGHARADQASDADQVFIELEQREPMRPDDVSGDAQNVLAPRPFVFLNACQSAQAGLSLTGPGGWARRFLRADTDGSSASAFVGTYWSVDDRAAFAFTQALYKGLFAGQSIAEATRAARQSIRRDDHPDPTWLAYTLYAHPHAKLAGSEEER